MPQLHSSPRARGSRLLVGPLVAGLLVTVAIAGSPSIAGAAKKPKAVMKVTVGDQAVYGVGNAPQTLPDDVRTKVMATLTAYLTAATVRPLQKGKVDTAALATAFDAPVNTRATTSDRGVLVDDGLPKATSKITVASAPVKLTGLADTDGKFVVVTAAIDATTTAKTKKGAVSIKRSGELVFSPAADGSWKVSGYDLTVDRVGKPFRVPAPGAAATTAPTAPAAAAPGTTLGTVKK